MEYKQDEGKDQVLLSSTRNPHTCNPQYQQRASIPRIFTEIKQTEFMIFRSFTTYTHIFTTQVYIYLVFFLMFIPRYFIFLKYILLIMLLQLSHFFPPFYSPLPCTPLPTNILPPQFMSMGATYKFFGFSISHTIPNIPLCILYLPFMLLIPCTFSLTLALPPHPPH